MNRTLVEPSMARKTRAMESPWAWASGMVVLGAALGMMGGCSRNQTLEDVQRSLAKRFDAHHTVTAALHVSTDVHLPDSMTKTEFASTIEYLRQGGKKLFRQEGRNTGLEIRTDGRSRKIDSTSLNIADGETDYSMGDSFGKPSVHKMKQRDSHDRLGGAAFFAELNRLYDLRLLPPATLDGVPVRVIAGTSRSTGPGVDEQVTYHIGSDDGVVRRCELLTNDGKSKIVMTVTDVHTNVPLAPERFVFQAPPGVPVVDMDELSRLMAEQEKLKREHPDAAPIDLKPGRLPGDGSTPPQEGPSPPSDTVPAPTPPPAAPPSEPRP